MRILLSVHAHLGTAGGASGVTRALGDAYERLGHEVMYASFDDLPSGVPHQGHQLLLPWMLALRIARLQRYAPVDVVDASTGDASVFLALRRRLRRRRGGRRCGPVIATRSHGLEHTVLETHLRTIAELGQTLSWKYKLYHGTLRLRIVAYSLRNSDAALFLNEHEREYATARLGVERSRAALVANGLDESLLGLGLTSGVTGDESMRIAQIGSYMPRKGIKHGGEALNALLPRHERLHVTFVGTGCDRARVLADFDPKLHGRVHVVSRFERHELPRLLAGHHIKLFPTYSEGSSLALLEGMACGLAPVATAIPGNLAVVEHEKTALVVPPRDSPALVHALERLVLDPVLRDRVRANAYERAQEYGWRAIAESIIEIYRAAGDHGRTAST